MKLLSSRLRLLLVAILSLGLSACATTGTDPVEPATAEQTAEAAESTAGTVQPGAKVSTLPMVDDPMKIDLPLDLIKVYDQAKNLVSSKNYAGAIARLNAAQASFPDKSGPSYRIARIYLTQKDYEKALNAINKSVEINSKNYYAHNLKGVILRELGKFADAKAAYLAAVTAYPRHAQSHLNLGILADIYMYDLPLALKHYEYYLELIQAEDKKVNGWVIDLKRRIPQGN